MKRLQEIQKLFRQIAIISLRASALLRTRMPVSTCPSTHLTLSILHHDGSHPGSHEAEVPIIEVADPSCNLLVVLHCCIRRPDPASADLILDHTLCLLYLRLHQSDIKPLWPSLDVASDLYTAAGQASLPLLFCTLSRRYQGLLG